MELQQIQQTQESCQKIIELAIEYNTARQSAGQAKKDLDLLLASRLKSIRERKRNVGYEMALLMLCEENSIAQGLYATMIDQTNVYKGIERLIDAHKTNISFVQSYMKYVHEGEKFG